jgi:predicted transcriptional regulator YdeE
MKEIRIEEREKFQVAGLFYHGKSQQGEIPAMWQKFMERSKEIPMENIAPFERSWGVSVMDQRDMEKDNFDAEFDYIACLEVKENKDIPEGMVHREVPTAKWLVFEHKGSLQGLSATYHKIYQKYIPTTSWKIGNWCLEMYDKRFDPTGSPESYFEIWVQVS